MCQKRGGVHAQHVCGHQRSTLGDLLYPSTMWALRMGLMPSGLAASSFVHWAISFALSPALGNSSLIHLIRNLLLHRHNSTSRGLEVGDNRAHPEFQSCIDLPSWASFFPVSKKAWVSPESKIFLLRNGLNILVRVKVRSQASFQFKNGLCCSTVLESKTKNKI